MNLKFVLFICVLSLLSSCSSFVDRYHSEFNSEEQRQFDSVDHTADNFDLYRRPLHKKARMKTDEEFVRLSTIDKKFVVPTVKRQYRNEREVQKRYTASDLTDNTSEDGSLWTGNDTNNYLFTNSTGAKKSGDIIQIDVMDHLRNEISLELKKAFPDNPFEKKAKPGDNKTDGKDGENKEVAKKEEAVPEAGASAHDRISGVIVEEINREHLLVKGRKNVLFKNKKRTVEVQALISRKDISEDATISSDRIIENAISVLR